MALVKCSECGEEENLSRVAVLADGRFRIHCGRCGHEWVRGTATVERARPTRTAARRPARTRTTGPIDWNQRAIDIRANPGKQRKFEKLKNSSVFEQVIELNRAYLNAAVKSPEPSELQRWIVSCIPGTTPGRQSAVNMRTMEVFVIHAYDDDPGSLWAFVILDGAHLGDQTRFSGVDLEPSGYVDAPPTQVQATASGPHMLEALSNPQFAAACRELARGLMLSGRTMQWKGHNFQLADAILDRASPVDS